MKYYVYKATLDSIVVYIGKGSGDRYKHLVSGISSNYDANKAHFSGQVVDLEIVEYFECEDFAYKRETELIYELAPLWNYQIRGVRIDPTKPPKTYKSRGVQYMPNKRIKQWRAYSRHPETRAKVHISYHMTEDEALSAVQEYEKAQLSLT